MTHWLIIRAKPKRDVSLYKWAVEVCPDAWLPTEPRFNGARQWWGRILPGRFFAIVPTDVLPGLYQHRDFAMVERAAGGGYAMMGHNHVMAFREQITAENAAALRMAPRINKEGRTAVSRRFKSVRLRKRGKAATGLLKAVETVLANGRDG